MIYLKVSISELIFTTEDLETLKPVIERALKQESRWVGSGKPNIEFVRPATLSDANVSLIDGNEVEVKHLWYKDNVLDKG